jgi:ElaB/YqjD/DUF883 family membrane-anchored ribosome-binding protein
MSYLLPTEYRPAYIEFDVASANSIPDVLGNFETLQEASDFIGKQLAGFNQKITVFRFIDNFEKSEIRKEYNELLENKIPILEKELSKATSALAEAKKNMSDAVESVNATINEAKALAMDVKRGVKDITLDDISTWRVPFNGQYFFYTYMDKVLKLAKVQDIPDHEKQDIFSASHKNDEFFNSGVLNE